jgi:hypothetical protein
MPEMKTVESCISIHLKDDESPNSSVVFDAFEEALRPKENYNQPILLFLNNLYADISFLSEETFQNLTNLAKKLLSNDFDEIYVDHLDINNRVSPPIATLNVAAKSSPQALQVFCQRKDIAHTIIETLTRG